MSKRNSPLRQTISLLAFMTLQTRLFIFLALIFISLMGVGAYSAHYLLNTANQYWLEKFTQKQMGLIRDVILQPVWQSLSIAQQLGQEPALLDMAEQANNLAAQQLGQQLLERYRERFDSHSYFAAFSSSNRYYFNDAQNSYAQNPFRYTLSQQNEADQWFYKTLAQQRPYTINVERNERLNRTDVWINVLLKRDKKILGIAGTGITLHNFLQQTQALKQEGILNFFVNRELAIQLADDESLIDFASITKAANQQITIERVFDTKTQQQIQQVIKQQRLNNNLKTVITVEFHGKPHFLGIMYIPELDWFGLTLMEREAGLSGTQVATITTVAIALFLCTFLLLAWVLNRRIVHPLSHLRTQIKLNANTNLLPAPLPKGAAQEVAVLSQQLSSMMQQRNNHEHHLRTTVSECTKELESARQHAEQALRIKALFLANMSHEIRTPMNAIMGMMQLTLQTPLNAQQSDYLRKADQAAQNLLCILNDILDFSKIEAGKLTLTPQAFCLETIASQSLSLFTPRAAAKGLRLFFEVKDAALLGTQHNCQGDPLRLMQVLNNLLDNAIKFTQQGHVKLHITRSAATAGMMDSSNLRFSVEDTGMGIPTQKQAQLFHEFTQIDASSTRSYGGTGLGLAISKSLVELMGGRIWVENNAGQGARFVFTAQLHFEPAPEPLLCDAPQPILLIEDDVDTRNNLSTQLCQLGLTLPAQLHACDSQTGLAILQAGNTSPDWIFINPMSAHYAALRQLLDQLNPAPHRVIINPVALPANSDGTAYQQIFMPILPSTLRQLWRDISGQNPHAIMQASHSTQLLGLRVLLVEDHVINQEITQTMLVQQGAQCTLANNGLEALRLLNESVERMFDVVLMDVHMPVLDGIATTEQLRALPRFAELPIIAITASALVEEQARCLAAGMNAHLSKPFSAQQLYDILAHYLPAYPAPAYTEPSQIKLDLPAAAYQKLRAQFAAEFSSAAEQLEQLMHESAWQDARQIAHNLKGVSGFLDLAEILYCAARIETACQQQRNDVEALQRLKIDLASTLSEWKNNPA